MSPRRILYHHRIRADDGQATHVRELIGALRAGGHAVDECALVRKANAAPAAGARAGGLWRRLALPRWATELLEIGYDRTAVPRLVRAGRAIAPDFVYERHALHCRAGGRAANTLGVPLLLEVNSPMVDEMSRLGALRFAGTARRREREALGSADAVLAVTEVLRTRLIACGARPDRTVVIGNGADPARYDGAARAAGADVRARLGLGGEGFALGFVGFMRPWHRLDLAVEQLARPELGALHLVLVGDGPALPDVLARAAELGVRDRVHAPGAVAPAELPGWVCAFDAALIPAINDYASPLKLFDSLAAGVVTVAPRQPNLLEYLDDGTDGVLFAPGDASDLGDRLAELCADPERAERIGAAGAAKLRARDWTWAGNARRVVAAFERIARGEALR